jgi:hypothetical protein
LEQLFAKDDLNLVGQPLLLLKLKVVRWLPLLAAASQRAVAEVTKQLTLLKI